MTILPSNHEGIINRSIWEPESKNRRHALGEVPVLAVDLVEFDVRRTKDATSPLPRVVDEGPETRVFHAMSSS
jgi:hypothetical protein